MSPSHKFLSLIAEMEDIHRRKNAGYAGEASMDPWKNFRMAEMLNISAFKGCLVRMGDKYSRICNLAEDPNNEQVSESIHDTLIDLANYSLIAICLYEEMQEMEAEKNEMLSDEEYMLRDKLAAIENSLIGKHVRVVKEDGTKSKVGVVTFFYKGKAAVFFDGIGTELGVPLSNLDLLD